MRSETLHFSSYKWHIVVMAGVLRSQHSYGRAPAYPPHSRLGRHETVESGYGSESRGFFRTPTTPAPPLRHSGSNAGGRQQWQSVPSREGERSQEPFTPWRKNDEVRQRGAPCGTSWSPSVADARRRSPSPTTARDEDEVLT